MNLFNQKKQIRVINVLFLALMITLLSCKNKDNINTSKFSSTSIERINKESNPNKYNGDYSLTNADCNLKIRLTEREYFIIIEETEHKGEYKIKKENSKTYLSFKDFYGDDAKYEMEGLIENDTISIQNYGNSMNPYTRFTNCSAKYLIFEKRK